MLHTIYHPIDGEEEANHILAFYLCTHDSIHVPITTVESLSMDTSTTDILLQILMVSPGTHLVKDHESQSRTSEPQLQTKPEIENAWAFI